MLKMNRPIFIIQGDRIVFGVEEPQHDSRFQVVKSKEQICDDGFSFGTLCRSLAGAAGDWRSGRSPRSAAQSSSLSFTITIYITLG